MKNGFLTNETNIPEYTQSFTSQTSVVVTHNLGYKPRVWVEDGSGNELDAEVQHTSSNAFTVAFGVAQTGVIHYSP